MKPIVAYCRSANEPPDEPSAVRSQADAICDYAERRGLTLGSIYADAGASGVTLDRPALQQLIADCRAGKIGTVITKDPDRLSRDFRQFIALLHIFQTTGVRVEYTRREGQSDSLVEAALSAVAELAEARAGPLLGRRCRLLGG
jgi:site-specific DNA recombinase